MAAWQKFGVFWWESALGFNTSISGVNSGENHNFLGKLHGNTVDFLLVERLSSTPLGHKWRDQQVAS